jgi:short-subunit dehydrogenase
MIKNKTIVITGASSGIGASSAIEFAKKGANIILVSRRKEKLDELEKNLAQFNVKTMVCICDVSDKSQVSQMAKSVFEKFQNIDILVNNAGFAVYGSVNELSIEDIEDQMKTNYFGMVYCIKNFLPKMIEQGRGGHIVNVASVAASFGLPGIASYCASKFAMLGFSEGLKYELKDTGIGVTVVSPIMVRTNFFDHPSFAKMPPPTSTLSLNPTSVAKAIVKASSSSRLEIIVPAAVRGVVWAKHTVPFLINPLVSSSFKKQLKTTKQLTKNKT